MVIILQGRAVGHNFKSGPPFHLDEWFLKTKTQCDFFNQNKHNLHNQYKLAEWIFSLKNKECMLNYFLSYSSSLNLSSF
jgi:hypothetical protein